MNRKIYMLTIPEIGLVDDMAVRHALECSGSNFSLTHGVWLVCTSLAGDLLMDRVKSCMGGDDDVILVTVDPNQFAARLYNIELVADWIKSHM